MASSKLTPLAIWRRRHGLTTTAIAAGIGCDVGNLSRWCTGEVMPSLKTRFIIEQYTREATGGRDAVLAAAWSTDRGIDVLVRALACDPLRPWTREELLEVLDCSANAAGVVMQRLQRQHLLIHCDSDHYEMGPVVMELAADLDVLDPDRRCASCNGALRRGAPDRARYHRWCGEQAAARVGGGDRAA